MPVYTDWTVGQRVTADALNANLIEERDGVTPIIADSSTWGATEASITTVVATLESGDKYKIWFTGRISTDVAADASNLRIREDNLTGTQLQLHQVYLPTTTGNGWGTYFYAEYTAVSSASKTFALTAQRSIGTGTAHRIRAATNAPGYLAVERVMD